MLLKLSFIVLLFTAITAVSYAQVSKSSFQTNPWKKDQLISAAALAGMISKKEDVKVYNIA